MERNIFVSHSRYDNKLLPWFGKIFEVAHVAMIKMEVENPLDPPEAIIEGIRGSEAVFVLLSEHVIKSPHTTSWVIAESTIGRMLEKPVLVFIESSTSIKLPIPYLDFYTQIRLTDDNFDAVRRLVELSYYVAAFEQLELITCRHPDCRSSFRTLNPLDTLETCPTCLRELYP